MALQIANPAVVAKVERLARTIGLSKTAAVEQAVDRLLSATTDTGNTTKAGAKIAARMAAKLTALLARLDRIPDRQDVADPLAWDEHGLPQ